MQVKQVFDDINLVNMFDGLDDTNLLTMTNNLVTQQKLLNG
jgi:hypothetical protein